VDTRVEVPIIEKRVGQVLAITGDSVQLMDMENFDTFEVPLPEEEEIKSKLEPGVEVEYWVMPPGVYKIMRIRGGK
jgi:translation initiation factor 5A